MRRADCVWSLGNKLSLTPRPVSGKGAKGECGNDIPRAVVDEASGRGGVSSPFFTNGLTPRNQGDSRSMAQTLSEFQLDVLCDVAEFVRIHLALTIL